MQVPNSACRVQETQHRTLADAAEPHAPPSPEERSWSENPDRGFASAAAHS